MIVETPDPRVYGAAVLAADAAAATPGLAVVLKAAYDLVADGAGPRRMVPAADPARAAIVMADQGQTRFSATDTVPPILDRLVQPSDFGTRPGAAPGDPEVQTLTVGGVVFEIPELEANPNRSLTFTLAYEADTALAKNRADIVVLGFVAAANGGAVVVDGTTWLRRTPPLPADPDHDTTTNLFGFQPRLGSPRQGLSGDPAAFAVYHRRGGIFTAPGVAMSLPSGAVVAVFQTTDTSGTPAYSAVMPDLTQAIRLRVYCGHGPDTAPRWRKLDLGTLHPDTLILRPAEHTALILWRRRWPADLAPLDTYRSVQIRPGGF